uniref:U3 small nucleolar RNA-associated protein 15 homolog n=2 Tax=Ciona intestinalis TaxID=7719 RepID=F7BQ53_CIOIN
SSRYKSTEAVPIATAARKHTQDYNYWRSLQFPIIVKEYGAVTNVEFQPTEPHHFAVTASSRVELYSKESNEVVKTFSRFHNTAYGASFRSDGKLLVAGNEDTQVRLFDVQGRVPLRIFKGHSRPVHVTKFCNNKQQLFSASDDKTVRVWDISTEQTLNEFCGHEDYVRCGCISTASENTIVTGAYDHTVRMFDTRSNANTITINHGCPVESVLLFPSGSIILSAGGHSIKVWDALQGGKLLTTVSNHHKTITCMTFNHDCTRLLSGSLDRHVKIYDVTNYKVVHNIDYAGSILSMAVSPNDETLVVGMADKMLSIRHRKQCNKEEMKEENLHLSKRKQKSMMRGRNFVPNKDDIVVQHHQKQHLAKYDQYFRKFEHSKALDAALVAHVSTNSPEITVAVLQELIRRDTIRASLSGRTGNKLVVLLKFLCRNISNVSFAPTLLKVCELLLDSCLETIENVPVEVSHLFKRLQNIMHSESLLQVEMTKLLGSMDLILSSSIKN